MDSQSVKCHNLRIAPSMADNAEWFVTEVLARLGEYCLVAWEPTDGVEYPPSWIHRSQLRTKGFHNAITRRQGWWARVPVWHPALGYFEGHPE